MSTNRSGAHAAAAVLIVTMLVAALVAAIAISGADAPAIRRGPTSTGASDPPVVPRASSPMVRVARDRSASVGEIAALGGLQAVARVDDTTLVVWAADSGGEDAGPSVAVWQLYRGDELVTEGRGPWHRNGEEAEIRVWPLRDGYLLAARRYLHVGTDGAVDSVATGRPWTTTTEAEAIDAWAGGGGLLYGAGRLHDFDRSGSGGGAITAVLDGRGGVWDLTAEPGAPVRWSADGAAPYDVPAVPRPVAGQPGWPSVAGGRMLVTMTDRDGGLRQILAWSLDDPTRPAVEVPTDGLVGTVWWDSGVVDLGGGRLAIGGFGCGWWTGSLDGGWQPMSLPDPASTWMLTSAGGLLYASGYPSDGGFVSRDDGRTWRRVLPGSVT